MKVLPTTSCTTVCRCPLSLRTVLRISCLLVTFTRGKLFCSVNLVLWTKCLYISLILHAHSLSVQLDAVAGSGRLFWIGEATCGCHFALMRWRTIITGRAEGTSKLLWHHLDNVQAVQKGGLTWEHLSKSFDHAKNQPYWPIRSDFDRSCLFKPGEEQPESRSLKAATRVRDSDNWSQKNILDRMPLN